LPFFFFFLFFLVFFGFVDRVQDRGAASSSSLM